MTTKPQKIEGGKKLKCVACEGIGKYYGWEYCKRCLGTGTVVYPEYIKKSFNDHYADYQDKYEYIEETNDLIRNPFRCEQPTYFGYDYSDRETGYEILKKRYEGMKDEEEKEFVKNYYLKSL